jgi:hypothetical protein
MVVVRAEVRTTGTAIELLTTTTQEEQEEELEVELEVEFEVELEGESEVCEEVEVMVVLEAIRDLSSTRKMYMEDLLSSTTTTITAETIKEDLPDSTMTTKDRLLEVRTTTLFNKMKAEPTEMSIDI